MPISTNFHFVVIYSYPKIFSYTHSKQANQEKILSSQSKHEIKKMLTNSIIALKHRVLDFLLLILNIKDIR